MAKRRFYAGEGSPTYRSPNRGLALLDEAIEQIELHAQADDGQWSQGEWRCSTGQCLAGWVSQLAGAEWAYPADHDCADEVIAGADDEAYSYSSFDNPDLRVICAREKAMLLLGLDPNDYPDDVMAHRLFGAGNSLENIKRHRERFARHVEAKADAA